MRHIPVLTNEVIDLLQPKSNMNVVDCTLGDAGHAELILEKTAPKGKLLGIDADPESLLRAKQYLYKFGDRVIYARDNFADLKKIVESNNFKNVDAIVMDLGWSSPQFAERGRGFSFEKDEALDMRYFAPRHYEGAEGDRSNPLNKAGGKQGDSDVVPLGLLGMTHLTAANIVNNYSKDELAKIFRIYGEEKLSKEIAEAIVAERKNKPIETTWQLVEIILAVYRKKLRTDKEIPWIGGLHPATKIFQALRIEVNQELEVLKKVLPQAVEVLSSGGRLAVITFHSLEDRIVKHYFQSVENKLVRRVNKKPIIALPKELKNNPRARSAKLRVVEKL